MRWTLRESGNQGVKCFPRIFSSPVIKSCTRLGMSYPNTFGVYLLNILTQILT